MPRAGSLQPSIISPTRIPPVRRVVGHHAVESSVPMFDFGVTFV
jgi:hypothetical protein